MTHQHTPALPASKRLAWLLALLAGLVVIVALGQNSPAVQAWTTPPASLDVMQSPGAPSTVAPGDPVTFTINETVAASATNLIIKGTLNAALSFVQNAFSAPYTSVCTISGQTFTCNAGTFGAGTIPTLVVSAFVRPASDGATIVQTAGSFSTQDGSPIPSGPVVLGPSSDLPTLTLQNRTLAISNSSSIGTVFEGSSVTFTASIANTTPSAASGPYALTMSIPNGTITTASCPSPAMQSLSPTSLTCTDLTGLDAGASASSPMSVTVQSNDLSGSGAVTSTIAVNTSNLSANPYLLVSGTLAATTQVTELNVSSVSSAVTTGATVSVCTTNMAASGIVGYNSVSNTFSTADYAFTSSGGAVVSAKALATCQAQQQGILFTSASAGSVTVAAGYNGVGRSNSLTFTFTSANNPAPTLATISPSTANSGSSGFTITLTGTNFISNSKVQWNGVDRTTSYVDATHLTFDILQSDLVNAGTGALRVVNPSPGGGTSSASNFTITAAPNPVPSVSDVTPDTSIALGAQFTLTVDGSNFVAASVVKWDSTSLVTHYVSDSQLTATVPAANILVPKTVNITVFNPTPAGGTSVEATPFTVNTAAAKLTFTKQPGNGVSGAPLSAQPIVAIQTVGGVTVTIDSATSVTLALVGSGTLTCTGGLSKTAVSGVATFAGCSVTGAAATGLTIAATADSLTSATSTAFNVTAAPAVSSTQLVVAAPAAGVSVARSRLTFTASVGTISPTPTALTFVVKRKSDNKYWNDGTGAWQADSFENPAVAGDTDGTWIFEVTGDSRRQFVGTTVIVTAHASTDTALYESSLKPEIAIR